MEEYNGKTDVNKKSNGTANSGESINDHATKKQPRTFAMKVRGINPAIIYFRTATWPHSIDG
jgi:hypothetical protein